MKASFVHCCAPVLMQIVQTAAEERRRALQHEVDTLA